MANADAEYRKFVQSRLDYWCQALQDLRGACAHEGHKRTNRTDSGYCETFYWTECHCPHCDKRWIEEK